MKLLFYNGLNKNGFWPALIPIAAGLASHFIKKNNPQKSASIPTPSGYKGSVWTPDMAKQKEETGILDNIQKIGGIASTGLDIFQKVRGVPTPHVPTGQELGIQAKDYYDTAFPGTNPWDRLGTSSPTGALGEKGLTAKQQIDMQRKEMALKSSINDKTLLMNYSIAEKQAKSNAISSAVSQGPDAIRAVLGALDGNDPNAYDSSRQVSREELPSKQQKNKYGALTPLKSGYDDIKGSFGEKGLIGSTIENMLGWPTQVRNKIIMNNGLRPKRFMKKSVEDLWKEKYTDKYLKRRKESWGY